MPESTQPILVTGATGYVGGRLVPRLLAAGYRVRAVARSLQKLRGRVWAAHPNIELTQADLHDLTSLQARTHDHEFYQYGKWLLIHACVAPIAAKYDA